MNPELPKLKAALREEVRAKLAELSGDARAHGGAHLCDQLRITEVWKNARSVLLFAPLANEPDIWPLAETALSANKILGLPRFKPSQETYVAGQVIDLAGDIVFGKFQIREPAASCSELPLDGFDLVLVPGLAFDLRGRRLGRGRGYYDRLLAEVRGAKFGVAFDEQIVAEVPNTSHDVCVDFILTPTRWLQRSG